MDRKKISWLTLFGPRRPKHHRQAKSAVVPTRVQDPINPLSQSSFVSAKHTPVGPLVQWLRET